MKKILVPTDFSAVSVNAVNFAADMALVIGAEIILFHAYQVPVNYSADMPLMMVSAKDLEDAGNDHLADLQQQAEQRTGHKVKVSWQSALGDTVDELENICKDIQPFAVVMGTKGKTGLEKAMFGSTTLTVIRRLVWPVIAVPPDREYGTGIKRIGFACDFKEVVTTVPALLIREMVQAFGAELHILNVDYRDKHFEPGTMDESLHLHELFKDDHPEFHYITDPDVEHGIDEFASVNDLDLIIAIPKKHKLLETVFKISSTKRLVARSKVPVMCIHDQ